MSPLHLAASAALLAAAPAWADEDPDKVKKSTSVQWSGCDDAVVGSSTSDNWFAQRLTPERSQSPFHLETVRVGLRHDPEGPNPCDSSGEFEVRLFLTSETSPPDGNPEPVATHTFPADPSPARDRDLVFPLPETLVIERGTHLHVVVSTNNMGESHSCIRTCPSHARPEANFFSRHAQSGDQWRWQGVPSGIGTMTFSADGHVYRTPPSGEEQ